MSDTNGRPEPEPTPFEAIVAWLPYLSDAERGRLRSMLCTPRGVSGGRLAGRVGSQVVQEKPYVTEAVG